MTAERDRLAALTEQWLEESDAMREGPTYDYVRLQTRSFASWLALRGAFDLDVERLARALQRVTEEEPGLLSDVDMLNDPTEGDPRPAAAAIAAAYREDAG